MNVFRFTSPVRAEGRFIRQSGPPGHYGHVVLSVEPSSQSDLSFSWEVDDDQIPPMFKAAVYQGVEVLFEPDARFHGFACENTVVRVVGGSFHETDSKELSFKMAAAEAFSKAVTAAKLA